MQRNRNGAGAFSGNCKCGAHRVDRQFGLEASYPEYVESMVAVFRDVRRVLRKDGTLWLNLGDSYATGAGKVGEHPGGGKQGERWSGRPALGASSQFADRKIAGIGPMTQANRMPQLGLKPKDLTGIPWRVAFALQADGWYLRQDIIWSKPNPMPESVRDRCTKAHEYLFLLSKSERYYFDQDAIMEPVTLSTIERLSQPTLEQQEGSWRVPGKTNGPMKAALPVRYRKTDSTNESRMPGASPHTGLHRAGTPRGPRAAGNKSHKYVTEYESSETEEHRTKAGLMKVADVAYLARNKRSVWEVTTQPFSEAHFATFPPALIEPCILAGCPKGGTVLARSVELGPPASLPIGLAATRS